MRNVGLTILGRLLLLAVAFALVGCVLRAQTAPAAGTGDLKLDLAAYKAELDRCSAALHQGEHLAQLRDSLPRNWIVQTENSEIVVSTDWLNYDLLQAERDNGTSKSQLRQISSRLAAMRKAADDFEHSSNQQREKSAQADLDKILQRREFASSSGPSQAELLEERISRWIAEQLIRLLSHLHAGRTTGNVVTWTIVGLAFALLCYWVWQNLFRTLQNKTPELQRSNVVEESRQWAQEALSAADRGDYREAVHCAYWATIIHLESMSILKRDHARTPRESLRLLEPHPKERQLLVDFTRLFELIWYGYRPALQSDWTNAHAHLEKMGCLATSTPATANS
jgi:hypothetical protein